MTYRFIVFLLFYSVFSHGQDTLKVKINSQQEFNKIMVYQVVGANQKYLTSGAIANEEFSIPIEENTTPGMYRIYYSSNGYFDFIYNQESVSVTFDADDPEMSAVFSVSKENITYQNYLNQIQLQQQKIETIQAAYLNDKKIEQKLEYAQELEKLYHIQNDFEIASKDLFAYSFIKSNEKYFYPEVVETISDYYQITKEHFFDYIDFADEYLLASSFFVDKTIEYVFYVNGSEEPEMDKLLKKEAISFSMEKVGENYEAKSEILNSLLYALATQEQIELVQFVQNNYYKSLPEEFVDDEFLTEIDGMISTAIGAVAPEITWLENEVEYKLSELEVADTYILVFWSTTCSHCTVEVPELYEFAYDLENLQVIAVALEEYREAFDSYAETMPKWIHVLGLNKWENEFAKAYQISSTPTYFVLDKDKKIVSKPYELEDLKRLFGAN